MGKRKNWIERICKEDGFKPKPKRDESESFLYTAHFFSKNLHNLDMSVKRVFAPVTYLPDPEGKQLEIWGNLHPDEGKNRITSVDFSLDEEGQTYKLWQIWADIFLPVFESNVPPVPEAQVTDDRNIFMRLLGLPNNA